MSNQTKGLAALLAAHGRNGDTELVHVNKRELAALEKIGNRNGIHTTTNPHTGLKEAFNWGSTLGAIGGGIAGTFAAPFTAGVINPYTGAALGSAAGTKLSGGSNEEALMNGVISGVTAWGIGGATDALAEAGKEAGKATIEEGVKTGVQEGAQQTLTSGTLPAATGPNAFAGSGQAFGSTGNAVVTPNAFAANPTVTPPTAAPNALPQGVEAFAKPDAGAMASIDPGYYGAENVGSQGVNTYTSQGTKEMVAAGAPAGSTSSVAPGANTLSQSGTNADYWSNVGKGIKSLDTPGKAGEFAVANKGNILAAGLGGYGMATDVGADADNTASDTGIAAVDKSLPATEVYYTDTGERRTRVLDRPRYGNINMAEGGLTFSDYDAADVGSDGGYAPGGLAAYAGGGGIGFIESIQPGGKWGDMATDAYIAADKNNPQWLKDIQPGGFIGATQPGRLGAEKRAEDEARRKREEEEGIAAAAAAREKAAQQSAFETKWSDRYGAPVTMASGGIAQRFDRGGASELDVTDLEHPAARYLRRAEAGGSPIVDKNVRGAAGRVGYNFPVGDTGNFNAGVSGYGMRAHAPGTDPVTRGRLTGVDLAYSPSQDRTISARYDAMAPASMPSYGGGYSAADFGGRPSEAQMMSMGPAPMARDRFSVNYRQSFAEGGETGMSSAEMIERATPSEWLEPAMRSGMPTGGKRRRLEDYYAPGGGISALGHYSDGGQMLRGPGDGVSDSIPASIEGKRPARLADGEFVIPARAVSELGNGSTEAGSKQLYAMLDRIAKKRKKGSGLAYQANPKKLMPV